MASSLALIRKVQALRKLRPAPSTKPVPVRQADSASQPEAQPQPIEDRFWAFFARVNPHLLLPKHFAVYVRQVLLAVGGDLRLVFAAPPQHGKTEVTLALIAFLVLEHPGRRWAYVTYNQKRANSVARKFKRLMANAGHVVGGTLAQMYLPGGGQMLFTSVDGGITGEPVDGAAFIDDPYKNRREADSQARRELIEETYREAIETRVHSGGSIFLLATRWHPQDLSGTLIEQGWLYINLQALAEGAVNDNGIVIDDPNGRRVGEALFPEKWPVEALEKKRQNVLEFAWAALYQGRPRPKGGKHFHEPAFYSKLPERYRGVFGLDLAYTAKAQSGNNPDWSICVELWREDRQNEKPLFYVVHVDRARVEAAEFALTLKARRFRRPEWRMKWRSSGTEKGSAGFLQRQGLPIDIIQPRGDKLVCADEYIPAWNEGRVLLPDTEHFPECEVWLHAFLDIHRNFTGTGREKDDDVDAAATAFDTLNAVTGLPELPDNDGNRSRWDSYGGRGFG